MLNLDKFVSFCLKVFEDLIVLINLGVEIFWRVWNKFNLFKIIC